MDAAGPMILPKGIVINTTNIYKEVADYSIVPPDKVWEYWHVYTTTYKKLKDPTACRLENFWWHVWGSDRRFLKGSALAKLYEDISVGPTFVPLKGPPNRWEGPDIPPLLRQIMEASAAAEAQFQQALSPQPSISTPTQPKAQTRPQPQPAQSPHSPNKLTDSSLKTLSSSASKPPPTHPILKKARGPSNSGPRPTARFISPHESAEDDDKDSEFPSSGSTIAAGLETRAYVTSPAKKTHVPTKKFAASTASKRRPVLSRRQSSQSAAASDVGSREGGSAASRRSPSSNSKQFSNPGTPGSDSSSSVLVERPVLSAKAAGKRPAILRRTTSEKKHLPRQENRHSEATVRTPPAQGKTAAATQARSMVDLPGHSRAVSEIPQSTKGPSSNGPAPGSPAVMARAQSHTGYERRREHSIGRAPIQGLFTGATASTSNVAVQGTILDQSGFGSMPLPSIFDQDRDSYTSPNQSPTASILDSRFTPTQPSNSASVPLGRTKSQLTLLLERETAKLGNKSRSRN